MAFHSIWVRGDRVRTSSCFLPLPCLPAHPERRTQHLRCACLAGEERWWHRQHRIEARWGVGVRQVWSWGVPVGHLLLWGALAVGSRSGAGAAAVAGSTREIVGGSCQTCVTWVMTPVLSFTTSYRATATEFGSFSQLVVKSQFREDFRGDCSYLSLRNYFDRMAFVLEEDYFMVLFISFLLQVCFLLHMHGYFLISEETVYSSLVY